MSGAGGAGGAGAGVDGGVGVGPADRRLEGVVAEFDEHVGLGAVSTGAGERYAFHCTQIAGGSRTIPVGATVTFVFIPGRDGRWEAGDLRPAPAWGPAPMPTATAE